MSHSSLDFFRDASDRNYFEMKSVSGLLYIESFFPEAKVRNCKEKSNSVFITDVRIIETNNEL